MGSAMLGVIMSASDVLRDALGKEGGRGLD